QQAHNLEKTNHATLQPLQAQRRSTMARQFECFKQGRDTGSVHVRDLRQIHDDGFRWLPSQHGQKPIPKSWGRINAHAAMQADECAFLAAIHGYVKAVGFLPQASGQGNSSRIPSWQASFHSETDNVFEPMALQESHLKRSRRRLRRFEKCLLQTEVPSS